MTDAAVIQATFADWRTVKGRKQLQLIFEVPLERQKEVLNTLGAPSAADPAWCAIAVLNMARAPVAAPAEVEKERQKWGEVTPTAQACIRCQEPIFQQYVIEKRGFKELDDKEKNAAVFIRRQCNINTRAALSTNRAGAAIWRSIDSDYLDWKRAESM